MCVVFFFFKRKTAYDMRISDWSSDVCSSDLPEAVLEGAARDAAVQIAHPLVLGLGPTTANQQRVLLLHQFDVALGEAGHRHYDAVLVLADLGDVVGG